MKPHERASVSQQIHDSAVVDDGAIIGSGTRIWHFCHVSESAVIGDNCSLGQNVFVANQVVIGSNVRIQNNVSIYEGVRIEDDVFIGPSVVFTNVKNPRAFVSRRDEYFETIIKRGASLGANSTIVCGVVVQEFGFVGAGAVVTADVPAYSLVVGTPARRVGWVSQAGERLDLPVVGEGKTRCPRAGDTYFLTGDVLTREG